MEHKILRCPLAYLERDVRELLAGRRQVRRRLRVERGGDGGGVMALALPAPTDGEESGLELVVVALPAEAGAEALPAGLGREVGAVLAVGLDGALEGRAMGWVRGAGGLFEKDVRVQLPGPGMVEVGGGLAGGGAGELGEGRWSRTRGALGRESLARMGELAVAVVGLGRLGSVLAQYLTSLPLGRLVLVDGDRVEPHNLGEGGHYGEGDIGKAKVEAWADRLALWRPELEVEIVAGSVTEGSALRAISLCDVVFSVPDRPWARLAAGAVAVAYHLPLVDVGTRIHVEVGRDGEVMGADVRLVPPGRCLLCCGGVAGQDTGRRALASAEKEAELGGEGDWQGERAGSLFSLNLGAAGLAARMWEEFLVGRLGGAAWWHLGFGGDGEPRVSRLVVGAVDGAGCACRLAGMGRAAYVRYGWVLGGGAGR